MHIRLAVLFTIICCFLFSMQEVGASKIYNKGKINISCICKSPSIGKTNYDWHHVMIIPRDGFNLNMSRACRKSYRRHTGPNIFCSDNDVFIGTEYAFDPEYPFDSRYYFDKYYHPSTSYLYSQNEYTKDIRPSNVSEDTKNNKRRRITAGPRVRVGSGCLGNACHDIKVSTMRNGCLRFTNIGERDIRLKVESRNSNQIKRLYGGQTTTISGRYACITLGSYRGTMYATYERRMFGR